MESHIRQICGFSDHFWYPEINTKLQDISKNKRSFVEVDLNKLYTKKPATFCNEISVLVSKILHRLKMSLSQKYKTQFAHSVRVLSHSEEKLKAALVLQKVIRTHISRDTFKKAAEEQNVKERMEKEQWDKAIETCKKYRKGAKVRNQFIPLRDRIRETRNKLDNEINIVNILTQYRESKETIKELDEKKPKGIIGFFKGESADNQKKRNNALGLLKKLEEQIRNNALISEKLKKALEEQQKDPQTLLTEARNERIAHENKMHECEEIIKQTKNEIGVLSNI